VGGATEKCVKFLRVDEMLSHYFEDRWNILDCSTPPPPPPRFRPPGTVLGAPEIFAMGIPGRKYFLGPYS
jgi:hypothetical protein